MFRLVATTDRFSKISDTFESRDQAIAFGRRNWNRIRDAGTKEIRVIEDSCGIHEIIWREPTPYHKIPVGYYGVDGKRYHLDRPTTGKFNGWTFLVTGSDYHDRTTLAMIKPNGVVIKVSRNGRDVLNQIAKDPFARATEYGQITGRCSSCGRKLEDPESRRIGMGPVCRQKFGV